MAEGRQNPMGSAVKTFMRDGSWTMVRPGLYLDRDGYGHVFPDEVIAELKRLYPRMPWSYPEDRELVLRLLRDELPGVQLEFAIHTREDKADGS